MSTPYARGAINLAGHILAPAAPAQRTEYLFCSDAYAAIQVAFPWRLVS